MKAHTDVSTTTTSHVSRRRFAAAIAGAGALAAGSQPSRAAGAKAAPSQCRAAEIVTLGNTGIKTSRLAQGTGFSGGARSSAHTRMGMKAFTELVRHATDRGVSFMDTADLYGSHRYLREALAGVPQDNYIVLSKIWPRTEYWNHASGGAKAEVERFRKELDRDVIDICLIHCMTNSNWAREFQRIRDELTELKEKGQVRAVGVSCHDFGALQVACTDDWTDVVLARINNVGKSASMDGTPEQVAALLKQARAKGKAVVGMKIFGNGKLTAPGQKDASLKYVFENDLVDAMTIGTLDVTQVDDTIERINKNFKA